MVFALGCRPNMELSGPDICRKINYTCFEGATIQDRYFGKNLTFTKIPTNENFDSED